MTEPGRWETLSTDIVFETPFIKVHSDQVKNHNGKVFPYSYMELQNPVVSIVVINPKGKMLLQKNYRHILGESVWEIPAGYIDAGETPLDAAKRELLEETGLAGSDWTSLGLMHQMVGTVKSDYNFFMVKDVKSATEDRDEDEQISDQTFFDLDEVREMIRTGEIDNAVVPLALGLMSASEEKIIE